MADAFADAAEARGFDASPLERGPAWNTQVAALALFAASLAYAVLTERAFYGDGAHFFIEMLERGGRPGALPERMHAHLLLSLPADLALWLGVTDRAILNLLFQVGSLLPWPLALWLCDRLTPRWLWLVVLAAAIGYLNAAFLAWGEHIVAHAFFWPAAFALLFARPLTPFAGAVLLLAAAILLRSYESLLFLGPCLAGIALWRLALSGESRLGRLVLLIALGLFLAATGIAGRSVLAPRDPGNLGDFQSGMLEILRAPSVTLEGCLVAVALLALLALWRWRDLRPRSAWLGFLVLPAALAAAAQPLLAPATLRPILQHQERVLDLAVPLALLALLLLLRRTPHWLESRRPLLMTGCALLLIGQSLWHLGATRQWSRYLGAIETALATHRGLLTLEQAALPTPLQRFVWHWTLPELSIALDRDGRIAALLSDPTRWRPFDPADPAALPELARYGVNYGPYLDALRPVR